MAVEQLTQMLNKQCGGPLGDAKMKVQEEGKKQVMKVLEKLPSKDDIKEKLISAACSIQAQKKMKRIYDKVHGLVSKLENVLLKAKGKLDALKAKLQKIVDKVLPKIAEIMAVLAGIIIVLKIVVMLAPITLAFCPPVGGGPCIQKISDIIAKAKGVVQAFGGAVKSVQSQVTKYIKIALGIIATIAAAILLITPILMLVQKIKALIEYLYMSYIQMCNTSDTSVMDEDGNINEKLLESEILKNDPTGLFALERDLEEIGLAEVDAAEIGDVGGVGDASGAENLNQGTDYGLGGESGLGDYGGTGIQATTSGFGHVGLGNNTRPNNELYGISDKLSQIYEDLLLELEGQGKTEIIERLNATDFGFQTRFERRIVPIN